jgi:DNA uptake protein ComE-like DNA-binding protein
MEDKIDLNTASDREIMNIHGISDAVALQIVMFRKQNASIPNWEALKDLPGFSDLVMETLKERTTISASQVQH